MLKELFDKFVDVVCFRMDHGPQPGTPTHEAAEKIAEALHERSEAMEVRLAALEQRSSGVTVKF
jgi:hypothetical protein